jgi:ribonuclease VapC
MSFVLDTSAVLASILGEPGGDYVHDVMLGSEVSAVNLGEIYTKLVERGVSLEAAVTEVGRFDFRIRAFRDAHAAQVAALHLLTKHLGLSFGDRACLAQGRLSGLPVLTADKDWAKLDIGIDIRQIR